MRSIFTFAVALILVCQSRATLTAAPPPDPAYKLVLQTPPATAVDSVAVSSDGRLVATAAGEGGVRLYDAQSGALLRTIGDAGDRGVVFSPDGRTLTAAGFHMDKLVGVYDVQTGRRVRALPGHTEWEAYATALSPDGKLLASTGTDKQILIWELETGKLRHQLRNQAEKIAALAFSPDSATLASGGGDRLVRLWDSATGQLRQTLSGHGDWVAALAFSPDGKTIASGTCDWGFHRGHDWIRAGNPPEQSEWRLWDVASGKVRRAVKEPGRLLSLAFAPDGKSLACGIGQNLRFYDLSAGTPGRVVASHDATITSIAFTPDGAALISGSHDQTVKRTNLPTGKTEWQLPGYFEHVNCVALSDDAALLVTGSSDHRFARARLNAGAKQIGPAAVRLWDLHSGRMIRRFGDPAEQVMAVAVSPDKRWLAAGGGIIGGAGIVRVWDAKTAAELWSTKNHAKELLAVAFSPAGNWLASAGTDGAVTIHDSQSGSILRTLSGHKGGATSLAFSGDGSVLVCGEGTGSARAWDTSTGQSRFTCPEAGWDGGAVTADRVYNSIGFSRDGMTLATCTGNVGGESFQAVRIWDAHTGSLKRDFTAEKIQGRPMALSPDGLILATGGKTVKLWDVRTGKVLRELYGHLKRTQSIVFSADGRLLVSGGSYGTTNVWDVATGRLMVTLFGFSKTADGSTNDDWLAYHPEGFYEGSPDIDRYLAWRVGDELQTPESLASQFHRPDRIEAALNLDLPKADSP